MLTPDGEIRGEGDGEHDDQTDADSRVDREDGVALPGPDAEVERDRLAAVAHGEQDEEGHREERADGDRDPAGAHRPASTGRSRAGRAELTVAVDASEMAPGGSCDGTCLMTRDFTPLEPDAEENKFYAPGIGLIVELDPATGDRVELVSFTGVGQ